MLMAVRFGNPRIVSLEILELVFGQQQMLRIVRQQHPALRANEEVPVLPLRDDALFPKLRLMDALIPSQLAGGHLAALAILINRGKRRRGDFGMRIGTERFDRLRRVELEGPERQIVPMATEVGHRAVSKIPPAIPFRAGKIDLVEWPGRRGTEP